MIFTQKVILGIVVISLLGSTTLAYGLSTEFLFKFDSGNGPTGSTSNSTHIFIANYKGLKDDEISKQIPENDVNIQFRNINEGRAFTYPIWGGR